MVKAKKSEEQKSASNVTETRPVGQGKDPLAEGNTLVNPSNTEEETHYDVKERSEDVQKADETGAASTSELVGEQATPATSVPNSDTEEQDEVAAGRVEPGAEPTAKLDDGETGEAEPSKSVL